MDAADSAYADVTNVHDTHARARAHTHKHLSALTYTLNSLSLSLSLTHTHTQKGEKKLASLEHPDPYRNPYLPGSTLYQRNTPVPHELLHNPYIHH